ncbi:MAG TPA: hypothetical protein VN859_04880 [Steroidobacteraceae bacterium]|nr:hypothetical protein [Steroidobacteraceae bacterium]
MNKPTPESPPPGKPQLGEVRHDERGQAVWHWAVDTARNAINSTSQLLRKLDLSGLSLEEDQPPPAAPPAADPTAKLELAPSDVGKGARKAGAAGEFNPYKSARPVAPAKPARPGQRLKAEDPARPGAKPRRPESAAPRPSWWRRLLGRG